MLSIKKPELKIHICRDLPTVTLIIMYIIGFFDNTIGLPSVTHFLIDVPVVLMLIKKRHVLCWKTIKYFNVGYCFIAFVLMLLAQIVYATFFIGWSLNAVYGFYRWFRFLIYFFCSFAYMSSWNVKNTTILFKAIFALNIILYLIQYFILGLYQDQLSGIFGTIAGSNMYVNMFYVIVTAFLLAGYFYNFIPFRKMLIGVGIMLLLSALSELKFFYVEFAVMLILCMVARIQKPKYLLASLIVIGVIVISYQYMISKFPEFQYLAIQLYEGGFDKLIQIQQHYSTDYDIGRAAFIERINTNYFSKRIEYWFGLGIGNCTSLSFLDNSFYIKNQIAHYERFQTAYTYIEQGWIGFVLYISLLAWPIVHGMMQFFKKEENMFTLMLMLMGVMGIFLFYYNACLVSQYSFMYFWALAAMFYMERQEYKQNGYFMTTN